MHSARAHIAAAFVLAHLVAVTFTALPLPNKRLTEPVKPRLARSVQAWGAPLVSLGVVEDDDALVSSFVENNNACLL